MPKCGPCRELGGLVRGARRRPAPLRARARTARPEAPAAGAAAWRRTGGHPRLLSGARRAQQGASRHRHRSAGVRSLEARQGRADPRAHGAAGLVRAVGPRREARRCARPLERERAGAAHGGPESGARAPPGVARRVRRAAARDHAAQPAARGAERRTQGTADRRQDRREERRRARQCHGRDVSIGRCAGRHAHRREAAGRGARGQAARLQLRPGHRSRAGTDAPVWGKKDEVAPVRIGHLLDDRVATSELAFLEGAGHVPMDDQPDALVEVVTGFFDDALQKSPDRKARWSASAARSPA